MLIWKTYIYLQWLAYIYFVYMLTVTGQLVMEVFPVSWYRQTLTYTSLHTLIVPVIHELASHFVRGVLFKHTSNLFSQAFHMIDYIIQSLTISDWTYTTWGHYHCHFCLWLRHIIASNIWPHFCYIYMCTFPFLSPISDDVQIICKIW